MLLEGVLERECLSAVLAPERVPGDVADKVSVQLVLGLGSVRAARAGEGTVAVALDAVLAKLGLFDKKLFYVEKSSAKIWRWIPENKSKE